MTKYGMEYICFGSVLLVLMNHDMKENLCNEKSIFTYITQNTTSETVINALKIHTESNIQNH